MNFSHDHSGRFGLSRQNHIQALFFLQALASGGLVTRIPDFQLALGLDADVLGLALMGQPVGAMAFFLFSSVLVERFGTRLILGLGIPLLILGNVVLALAPNVLFLTAGFIIYGATFALTNVAMNVEADRVEALTGAKIMNRCHGLWSFGFVLASLGGALARGIPVTPLLHFGLMLPVILIAVAFFISATAHAPPRHHDGAQSSRKIALPTLTTFSLVLFGVSGMLIEGGARNWSIIYMRDSFSAPDWLDTLTLPAFLLTMAFGRMFADGWISRYGARKVATALLLLASFGLGIVVFAPNLSIAMTGFAFMGIGVCVLFPMTMSAAAQVGDRAASENVAAVTMMLNIIGLGAPAMMGWLAANFGIRISFAAIGPLLILSLLLTRVLDVKKQRTVTDA